MLYAVLSTHYPQSTRSLQSEDLVPARILQVWDSSFVHVDYAAHGISGRLDEIVDVVRLELVVKFVFVPPPVPTLTPKNAGLLASKRTLVAALPLGGMGQLQRNAQDAAPLNQEQTPADPEWMAFAAEFKKTRTGSLLDQKHQELLRQKVLHSALILCMQQVHPTFLPL